MIIYKIGESTWAVTAEHGNNCNEYGELYNLFKELAKKHDLTPLPENAIQYPSIEKSKLNLRQECEMYQSRLEGVSDNG